MAELAAVVFDYGDTLMRFRYDRAVHARSLALVAERLGAVRLGGEQLLGPVDELLSEAMVARGELGELDYVAVVRQALAGLGVEATAAKVVAAMRAAQRVWAGNRELHPATIELLQGLRRRGLAVGLVSNTIDAPEVMMDDLELVGIAGLIDAAVFSSQLGVRKPHPAIYRHALRRLGVEPQRALFVGDRVREDVIGPAAVGMRTCLAVYFRQDGGDRSLAGHLAEHPLDVLSIVDGAQEMRG
jgi:HAD superfamily hydrolase (TIGR01509 family)